ncbi:MAG: hypothetical protein M0Q44_19780 [Methylobacter sp.]|nr:hypothetical protein [Methylobacter sp.]
MPSNRPADRGKVIGIKNCAFAFSRSTSTIRKSRPRVNHQSDDGSASALILLARGRHCVAMVYWKRRVVHWGHIRHVDRITVTLRMP